MSPAAAAPQTDERRATWISLGFERLVHEVAHRRDGSAARPFDVLIVGSGYGGAVAASELAGCRDQGRPITVCVLERGQEYLEGAFPDSVDELTGHVRFSSGQFPQTRGNLDALFDVRLGEDINVLVANGLGGGSLINAGVMLQPEPQVLHDAFAPQIAAAEWPRLFERARHLLGASLPGDVPNAYDPAALPAKGKALASFAPGNTFKTVPITVALTDRTSSADVELKKCLECGDCATGCNHGAKDSLDVNLLVSAAERDAAIYTGATVLRLHRDGIGWAVDAVPTDRTLRERHGPPTRIHARKVILAAGTLGSTEILLKSSCDDLAFSAQLGRNFSSNGDMIAAIYGHTPEANAIARESDPPADRHVGPTITASIDLRRTSEPFMIQEMAVPAALRRMFEEVTAMSSLFQSLACFDLSLHGVGDARARDPLAVDWRKVKHSSLIAMMGDDGADGTIELRDGGDPHCGDAMVAVRWEQLRTADQGGSIFDRQMDTLERLARHDKRGEVLPNPVWRLLPKGLEFLFDSQRGPPLTVHPLGGCAMGRDVAAGVVDHLGRVFDAQHRDAVHPGLVVLDGSVMPRALGVNPSLTITAFALRAVAGLRDHWGYAAAPALQTVRRARPVLKANARPEVKPKARFEIRERLAGPVHIPDKGSGLWREPRFAEVTLAYRDFPLSRLMRSLHRHIKVQEGRLRVFKDEDTYRRLFRQDVGRATPGEIERELDRAALYSGPITGRLLILHRGVSWFPGRIFRGVLAWACNRGARDIINGLRGKGRSASEAITALPTTISHAIALLGALLKVASRAGEIREFGYRLQATVEGRRFAIHGRKRITYSIDGNLWEQLERMRLTKFGDRFVWGHMDVDMDYFAAQAVPLMRVARQPNMPAALVDLGTFGSYFARLMVSIHAWSLRRPDTRPPRAPERLPGAIRRNPFEKFVMGARLAWSERKSAWDSMLAGFAMTRAQMPAPVVTELPMGEREGQPVRLRLTRYPKPSTPERPPVLLLHGYSASGTTFAHPAVFPALGEYLSYHGRDVWILDMRTSSGMDTAGEPWTFEDAALQDIPVAVAHILQRTGREKLDVVAHCMGAAMFSMAVLAPARPDAPYFLERSRLAKSIRCAALSQVGPLMQFSPLNVLRAYVMRYIRYYFNMSRIEFRVPEEPKLAAQLADRFLATLRYPRRERAIENRGFVDNSFVGTRHRIDALYGRSFSLANLNNKVLDEIDDFFGPLNFDTVAQTLHFALKHRVTDSAGRACYLTRETRDRQWTFDTLTVHGLDNGLMDVATRNWIDNYFNTDPWMGVPQGRKFVQQVEVPHAGHQDSLIGKTHVTGPIFRRIRDFLDAAHETRVAPKRWRWMPLPPHAGPIWTPMPAVHSIALSGDPGLGVPDFMLCVPVKHDPLTRHYRPAQLRGTVNPSFTASTFVLAVDAGPDGWHRISLPNYFLDPNFVDGVLLVHCYDHTTKGGGLHTLGEAAAPVELGGHWAPFGVNHRADIVRILGERAVETNLPAKDPNGTPAIDALLAELNQPAPIEARVAELLAKTEWDQLEAGFIAAPGEARGRTRIFAGSCQYPQGILDERVAWRSYERMGKVLDAYRRAEDLDTASCLALFVGDQVYADATAGLFDPKTSDDQYRQPHQDLFSNGHVKKVLRTIPSAFMLDDHELRDNWEPSAPKMTPKEKEVLDKGVAAYESFQRRASPPPPHAGGAPARLWFERSVGGVPVFVADTRTDRLPRVHGAPQAWSIMREPQVSALLSWLGGQKERVPKIVACPAMLLPRRLRAMRSRLGQPVPQAGEPDVLAADGWEGFPATFGRLLAHIADEHIENVIFVSGDEHLFCDSFICVRREGGPWAHVRSIHASPLYAPYPFANSKPEDFPARDRFTFRAGGNVYECIVDATFHPQVENGFVELEIGEAGAGGWDVTATFHGADARVRRVLLVAHAQAAMAAVPQCGE